MTLARIRKESQVYSAEEKKALAALSQEEKHLKEHKLIADLRALATETQQKTLEKLQDIGPPRPKE